VPHEAGGNRTVTITSTGKGSVRLPGWDPYCIRCGPTNPGHADDRLQVTLSKGARVE